MQIFVLYRLPCLEVHKTPFQKDIYRVYTCIYRYIIDDCSRIGNSIAHRHDEDERQV